MALDLPRVVLDLPRVVLDLPRVVLDLLRGLDLPGGPEGPTRYPNHHEVTKTMPSQQEIRAAFQRLISPLKVADEGF